MEIKWLILKNLLYKSYARNVLFFTGEQNNGNSVIVRYTHEKIIAYLELL